MRLTTPHRIASALRPTFAVLGVCAAFGLAAVAPAQAQEFPNRTITVVCGYGPGSGIDTIAREVAGRIAETMKVSVIVDNKPGANGGLANDYAAQAKPDGYTILIISNSGIINELTSPTKTRVGRDFDPIAFAGTLPYAFGVAADFPAKNMTEFVAYAKARPNQINWASLPGGLPQYLGEILNSAAGISMMPVPYKTTTDSITDVISGRVALWVTTAVSGINTAKGGKMRLLGITSDKRIAAAPDVPTMKEQGFDALTVDVVFMFMAPKGVPAPIVARLNREITAAVAHPRTLERFAAQGVEPRTGTDAEVRQAIQAEQIRWEKVVAASPRR